ncbi:hypothetical protein ACHAXT_006830 [Thalassiosira profunda]
MEPALIPTESPVPGVPIELATLLVQAIKARRKYLSKTYAPASDDDAAEKLRGLREAAEDKTTSFLNELRKIVERYSAAKKSTARRKTPPNAPTRCVEFLFGIVADGSNSFHLRRAALALMREILERSSEARAFIAEGQVLLDFVSVVEGVDSEQTRENGESAQASASAPGTTPGQTFQMEAMELIHHLASKFGHLYTQFTVASRLLGDVSVNLAMHEQDPSDSSTQNGGGRRRSNMRMLRRQRDVALERGPKACSSLERMIERADGCFRILVPRFGGFNVQQTQNGDADIAEVDSDAKPAADCADGNENDDEDSIDWEEGDVDFSEDESYEHPAPEDHEAAVEQTLDILGRGGALLDGQLAVKMGSGNAVEHETPAIHHGSEPANLDDAPTSQTSDTAKARQKLQCIVEKLSTRLRLLNQWIHALSRADGMEERAVHDAATAPGEAGPVSLVLLSEEKRKLRGELLQRMMKILKEVESVLQSAAKIGIPPEAVSASGNAMAASDNARMAREETASASNVVAGQTRQSTDDQNTLASGNKRKKPKHSRFKITYDKR